MYIHAVVRRELDRNTVPAAVLHVHVQCAAAIYASLVNFIYYTFTYIELEHFRLHCACYVTFAASQFTQLVFLWCMEENKCGWSPHIMISINTLVLDSTA